MPSPGRMSPWKTTVQRLDDAKMPSLWQPISAHPSKAVPSSQRWSGPISRSEVRNRHREVPPSYLLRRLEAKLYPACEGRIRGVATGGEGKASLRVDGRLGRDRRKPCNRCFLRAEGRRVRVREVRAGETASIRANDLDGHRLDRTRPSRLRAFLDAPRPTGTKGNKASSIFSSSRSTMPCASRSSM